MGPVLPPAIAVTFILAVAYAFYRRAADIGDKPRLTTRVGIVIYWLALALLLAHFLRVLVYFHDVLLLAIAVVAFLPVAFGKWRAEAGAGLLLNACALLFFIHFIPEDITPATVGRLVEEEHARPVYTFFDASKKFDEKFSPPNDGIRTMLLNGAGDTLYFTVDTGAGENIATLYRVPLDGGDVVTYSGGRLFGLAFTPGEEKLLATSYYDRKLLVLDPEDLSVRGSRETSEYPQFIIPDERGGRVTVTHEGLGIVTRYALPDLEYIDKTRIASAPSKIAVDYETRTFFAANWMYYYMLTEVEMYSLRRTGKKFFMSFDSGGIDLDQSSGRVYISKGLSGIIFGVDRETFEIVDRIRTSPFVRAVCVDERRGLIYAGNVTEPYIRAYRPGGDEVGKIYAGPNCRDIIVDPDSGRVFAGTVFGVIELEVDKILK